MDSYRGSGFGVRDSQPSLQLSAIILQPGRNGLFPGPYRPSKPSLLPHIRRLFSRRVQHIAVLAYIASFLVSGSASLASIRRNQCARGLRSAWESRFHLGARAWNHHAALYGPMPGPSSTQTCLPFVLSVSFVVTGFLRLRACPRQRRRVSQSDSTTQTHPHHPRSPPSRAAEPPWGPTATRSGSTPS